MRYKPTSKLSSLFRWGKEIIQKMVKLYIYIYMVELYMKNSHKYKGNSFCMNLSYSYANFVKDFLYSYYLKLNTINNG